MKKKSVEMIKIFLLLIAINLILSMILFALDLGYDIRIAKIARGVALIAFIQTQPIRGIVVRYIILSLHSFKTC